MGADAPAKFNFVKVALLEAGLTTVETGFWLAF